MTGIYKITNPNGEIYIGQTSNWKKRLENYLCKNNNRQKILFESFLKYGVDNHSFEIIEECNSEMLAIREKYWIKHYNSCENGLNGNKGGGGVLKHSEETRIKISKTKLDNPRVLTDEMINRYREGSSSKKPVYQYDLEGNFIDKYPSIMDAARCLNIRHDNISCCIRKKQKTGNNFQWFDSFQDEVLPIKKHQKPSNWIGNKHIEMDKYIDEIHQKYNSGYSIKEIATEYNVHCDTIKYRLNLK